MAAPTEPVVAVRSIRSMLQYEIDRLEHLREKTSVRTHPALVGRVERAISAASCPMCAEAQADGVPCAGPDSVCEHCARALESMRRVRSDLEAEARRLDAEILGGGAARKLDPP